MTNDWTKDPRFNHFWKNYKQGQSWYCKHQISYWRSKAVAMNYENSFLHWFVQSSDKVSVNLLNITKSFINV